MEKLELNNQETTGQDVNQGKILSKELTPRALVIIKEILKESNQYLYINGFYRAGRSAMITNLLKEEGENEISLKILRYDLLESIESFLDLAQVIINSYDEKRFEVYNGQKILLGVSDLMQEIEDGAPLKLRPIKEFSETDLTKFSDLFYSVRDYIVKNSTEGTFITKENFGIEKTLELAEFIVVGIKDINLKENSVESFLKMCDALNIENIEGVKNKIKGTLLTYKEQTYRGKIIYEKEIDNLLNSSFTDSKSFFNEVKKVYELLKKSCDDDKENCSGWCRQITMNIGRYLNDKKVLSLIE